MRKTLITRRALMNAGAGLAAVSVIGCSPAALSGGAALPAAAATSYPGSQLAQSFVSIGVVRSALTAVTAAEFIGQPSNNAASKDMLFLPSLITDFEGPDLAVLAKSAQANSVWLALRARRGQGLADILIDSAGDVLEITGPSAMPTPLGNIAFASSSAQTSSDISGAEIVLQNGESGSYTDAYTISGDTVYSHGGDIIETAADPSQALISARIPIAGLRKLRAS